MAYRRPTEPRWTLPERVAWPELRKEVLELWEPGDHFSILGATGSGKSHLQISMVDGRVSQRVDRGVVVFGTKPRDPTLQRWMTAHKVTRCRSWDDVTYQIRKTRRVCIWPEYGRMSTAAVRNAPVYREALDQMMADGDWTFWVDEATYMIEQLHLRVSMDELYNAARSNGVSLLAGAQRPTWISRGMVSMMQWLATFQVTDEDDAKRTGEIVGNRKEYEAFRHIPPHSFILARCRHNEAYLSKVPLKGVNNARKAPAPDRGGPGGGRGDGPGRGPGHLRR